MSSRTSMMILSPQSNHGAKIEDDQNATNQITNETTTLVDTTTDSSYLGTTSLISMYLRTIIHTSFNFTGFFRTTQSLKLIGVNRFVFMYYLVFTIAYYIILFIIFVLEISPTLTSKTTHLSVPNGYSNATVKWSRTPDSSNNTNIVSHENNSKIVRTYEEFSDLSSNAIELEPVSQTNFS